MTAEERLAAIPTHGVPEQIRRRWDGGPSLLEEMCRHALVPSGKLLRSLVIVEATLAVGGLREHAVPLAAGIESGHVGTLIHDDIIDEDVLRRGRPSVQAKYGVGQAVVAGDALLFDVFVALAECRKAGVGSEQIVVVMELLAVAFMDVCRGQSAEFEIAGSPEPDLPRYLEMIRLKTAVLFRAAAQGGAVLGGGSPELVGALGAYGENLGLAFQIWDDLLAYLGPNDHVAGKPVLSDIRNGRMTLPVILAHRSADDSTRRLLTAASESTRDPLSALALMTRATQDSGAIEQARAMALMYVGQAKVALAVLPEGAHRDRLATIADLAIERRR